MRPKVKSHQRRFTVSNLERRQAYPSILYWEKRFFPISSPFYLREGIQLFVTRRSLTINVETPGRRYRKGLVLPVDVDESSARSKYGSGVLETVLEKRRKDTGTRIEIT